MQCAIRTVPRFGYHWVKPTDAVEAVPTVSPAKPGVEVVQAAPEEQSSIKAAARAPRRVSAVLLRALAALTMAVALVVIDRRPEAMSTLSTGVVVSPDLLAAMNATATDIPNQAVDRS